MVRYLLLTSFILFLTLNLSAQLSGSYSVSPGGGGDFSSLSDAAEALNSSGMSGNVTLQLSNGLYEEQVLFEIPGQTESQLLTIESASGNEADVVLRYADATEEENYQLGFSEIQALAIRNISIDAEDLDYGRGIQFFGICSNVTIDNLNHHGNRNDEAIFAFGFTDIFEPPQPIQGLTVTNSFFTECSPSISVGANLFGEPADGNSSDIVVTNNEFLDADGINAGACENVSFEDNVAQGDQFSVQPLKLAFCSGAISVVRNRIWNSFNTIEITTCVGTAANPILVANNFISGGESVVVLNSNTELSFVYNSVYGDDNQAVIASFSNEQSRILNNIFYQNDTEGFLFNLAAEDQAEMDYNNLYSNGSYGFTIGDNGVLYLDYEEYRDETGREENGISVQPIFEIPGEDLHTSNEALNVATPLAYVTTDIDGESRNPTNPTIGADEIDGVEVISDLVIDGVTTSGDVDAGQQLTVEWFGSNAGNTSLEASWIDRVFLSEDDILDSGDDLLTEVEAETGLAPGDPFTRQVVIALDLELSGTHYIIVRVDAEADLLEDNENNIAASEPFEIAPSPLPNLEVTDIELPASVSSGTQLQINFTVTNTGEAPASGNWAELIWFEDALINFDVGLYKLLNDPFATSSNVVGLMPGESYEGTATAETPYLYEGHAYLRVETDGYDDIVEELDGNDNFSTGMTDSVFINQSPLADLVIEEIQTPTETFAGEDITFSYTVRNIGTETTSPVELPFNFYFGYTWTPLFSDWVDYTYMSDTLFNIEPDQYEAVEGHAGNID
ncbi:MAG: CARDB domain-containing protein, partial [Cryomorphaceae bacterium]